MGERLMSLERFFSYPSQTVEYVANVSDRFKYFYLANPKAASTGVLRALQLAEVDGDPTRLPEFVHDRSNSPLLKISDSQFSPEEILSGSEFFRFTYVRNPFTRVLSAYLDKIIQETAERIRLLPMLGLSPDADVSFLDLLKAIHALRDGWRDIHWSTQTRLIQCNNISYSFIGRFETFDRSFPEVLKRLGIAQEHFDAKSKPAHATSASSRLGELLGHDERSLILTIYEADFVNFGYGRDPSLAHL
jgi:hypothetical protein